MVVYTPSLDREGESLGKDAMNMKKITIALFALAMAAVPAGAHVFDDAVFYFNGGKDANGDGYFNTGELRNIVDANASNTAQPTIANFHRMTNEVVHCPYSGKTFTSGCINFPQEITHTYTTNIVGDVTNVTVEARGRVSKVYIDNVFKDVTGNCSNYSVVVRFRRDAVPKVANDFQDWMLRIGYDWNNGGIQRVPHVEPLLHGHGGAENLQQKRRQMEVDHMDERVDRRGRGRGRMEDDGLVHAGGRQPAAVRQHDLFVRQ